VKALIVTVLAVGAIGLSGCGHSASTSPAAATSSSPSVGPTAAAGGTADPAPTATSSHGATTVSPAPIHSAARASFHAPVRYSNGLSVSVAHISEHKDTQTGPGASTGRPVTTFLLRFSNSTHTSIDLRSVVVNASYGPAHTVALAIYDSNAQNFHNVLRKGHTASAAYSFSFPAADSRDVELTVNFRPGYSTAIFVGSASPSGG
jgi:hypothetical protein